MRKLFFFLTFVFVFACFSTMSSAASPNKHILRPSPDTEKVFEEMNITVDNDTYKVTLKNKKEDQITEGYHIQVDPKKMIYKATKVKKEELDRFIKEKDLQVKDDSSAIASTTADDSTEKNAGEISSLATSTKYIQVKAVTDDPVGEDLAWTNHKLIWDFDGQYSYYNSRTGSCGAANPSSFGTHWYVDRCEFTCYERIDGGRTIASDLESAFHNYDFLDDDKRTDVTHDVYLEGYYNGGSWYSVTWTKSGEASSLLDLDIYVTTG